MIRLQPRSKSAYDLFHEGSLALAEAEFNGIRCDRPYCQRMIDNLDRQVQSITRRIRISELGEAWNRLYGSKALYSSGHQLREVLTRELNIKIGKKTSKGNLSIDHEVLEGSGREDLKLLLKKNSLEKMSGTYLKNFLAESEADGFIHPFFHLSEYGDDVKGGATTYRSSSSHPNFQNLPNRHEEERKLIRRAFLPRPGHRLVSRDYGGMEFKISACLHQDPNMIRYVEEGDDPHRDTAAHCFCLDPAFCTKAYGEPGKQVRFAGKNNFTFAQMYFQDPINTAKGLWGAIDDLDLRHPGDPDKPMRKHLQEKKIGNFDDFTKHIEKVCSWFWQDMFPEYGKWRDRWVRNYERNGYFDMLTGFRLEGVMTKYQLGNYPIQGPAFHCLLWSMIRVWKLWRDDPGVRSKIVGQIHDELTTDEHEEEFWRNQEIIPRIMSEDIRKEWKWIIVPLEVETEATGVDEAWYYKKGV